MAMDKLVQYFPEIALVVFCVCLFCFLYKYNKREILRDMILGLVVEAEKFLGSGTGDLKYAMVVNKIYSKFPKLLTLLFTKKELNDLIEEAVQRLKKVLSDKNINLLGIDEETFLDSRL